MPAVLYKFQAASACAFCSIDAVFRLAGVARSSDLPWWVEGFIAVVWAAWAVVFLFTTRVRPA